MMINSEKYFEFIKRLILIIVDYAKAFDTINQQKMLNICEPATSYSIPRRNKQIYNRRWYQQGDTR